MAYLMKPWLTRYLDAEGRQVPAGTPGARQVRERAKKWYGAGLSGWKKGKRVPLATHKATAQALLNKMVEDLLRGQHGLTDAYAEHRTRPVKDHVADFIASLRADGKTGETQLKLLLGRLLASVEGCGWDSPADMTSLSLSLFLSERRAKPRKDGGFGVQTSNFYLGAAKQFATWMVEHDRMPKNPFAKLDPLNVKADRRHDRRRLSRAETLALVAAARDSAEEFRGLTGADRSMLYVLALSSGLREGAGPTDAGILRPVGADADGNPAGEVHEEPQAGDSAAT